MSATSKLEQAFYDAVQNYLRDDEDEAEALQYFEGVSINKMIGEALEDERQQFVLMRRLHKCLECKYSRKTVTDAYLRCYDPDYAKLRKPGQIQWCECRKECKHWPV